MEQLTWARVGASYEDVSSEGPHWLQHLMGEADGAFMTSTAARKVTALPNIYSYNALCVFPCQ